MGNQGGLSPFVATPPHSISENEYTAPSSGHRDHKRQHQDNLSQTSDRDGSLYLMDTAWGLARLPRHWDLVSKVSTNSKLQAVIRLLFRKITARFVT